MSRKVHNDPNYSLLEKNEDQKRVFAEVSQIEPKTEVTIEGSGEIATGHIEEWYPKRNFFSVRFNRLPPSFEDQTESQSGLRAFFKIHLFSTQLLFKSTTLRRFRDEDEDGKSIIYHYRIPEQIYQQQRRGALRVPLFKNAATLTTPDGSFELIDLSVTGAMIRPEGPGIPMILGEEWKSFTLKLGSMSLTSGKHFQIKVARTDLGWCAIKFSKISDDERTQIKQFLIEALRTYYAKKLRPRS